jgi:hypothetical protein
LKAPGRQWNRFWPNYATPILFSDRRQPEVSQICAGGEPDVGQISAGGEPDVGQISAGGGPGHSISRKRASILMLRVFGISQLTRAIEFRLKLAEIMLFLAKWSIERTIV